MSTRYLVRNLTWSCCGITPRIVDVATPTWQSVVYVVRDVNNHLWNTVD